MARHDRVVLHGRIFEGGPLMEKPFMISQLHDGSLVWSTRFIPRPKGWVLAAADQVTRYGRQLADIERQMMVLYAGIEHPLWRDRNGVFDAWLAFIGQFHGNNREVLTRTFWQAYYS
jgi:hypothetical protein